MAGEAADAGSMLYNTMGSGLNKPLGWRNCMKPFKRVPITLTLWNVFALCSLQEEVPQIH